MSRQRRLTASRSSRVAGLDGDVDRAAVEVQLADGVAGHGRRLANRRVVLPVRGAEPALPEQPVAAPVDERARPGRGSAARR